MNVRHVVPSVSHRLLAMGALMLATGLQQSVHAAGVDLSKFRRIEPQFIAALGDPKATSGGGAQSWGFWDKDPGPRACKLDHYPELKATGVAPAQWKFDAADWWLEEHGLIMEKPSFPLPPGGGPALISGSSGSLPSVAMARFCLSAYHNAGLSVRRAKLIPANALGVVGITSFTQTASGPLKYEVSVALRRRRCCPAASRRLRWRNPAARTRPMSLFWAARWRGTLPSSYSFDSMTTSG